MKNTISIVVASFGDEAWNSLAEKRAIPSTEGQGALEVVRIHEPGGTIASARNNGLDAAKGEWVVFLDADDELAPGFVRAMLSHLEGVKDRQLLLTPSTQFCRGLRGAAIGVMPQVDMRDGSWLIIGTAVSRSHFKSVGGFSDGIDLYEDWHLWARCVREGSTIQICEDAVYRAHVNNDSRNRKRMSQGTRLYWHQWIGHDVFPESYEQTTEIEDKVKRLSDSRLRRLD